MKHYTLILFISLITFITGCSQALKLNQAEIDIIWNQYHAKEFSEGFYEKLSSRQRKEIMFNIAKANGLDFQALMENLKQNNPEKYTTLFY